jgi:hypothetical protein
MDTLYELDSEAIKNKKSDEYTVDELWDSLGAYNKEKVYPLVDYLLWNYLNLITKHPDSRISLTNEGRKHRGEKFELPAKTKELFI